MIYHHPLAYLLGVQGLALLRAWAGDREHDEAFVRRRIARIRELLDDPRLAAVPGVSVEPGVTGSAYARWAPSYDDPGNGLFDLDEPLIDEMLDGLPVGVALDAACGTGRLAARLAARGDRVIGVDGSAEMLQRARGRVPAADFRAGDLHALPVPDASVDLVLSGLALTHVADLTAVYTELARVLRPGGDLIVSDVHRDLVLLGSVVKVTEPDGRAGLAETHPHRTGDHLRAGLAAGFTVLRCEEAPRPAAVEAPLAEPTHDIGDWTIWPWTLLGWDPEASRAAWRGPAITVWHWRSVAGAR